MYKRQVENQIEAHVFNNCTDIRLAEGADIGRIKMCRTGVKDYVDFLQEHIDADLTGLKVLFDCANGASARVAQELFPRLGCECGFIGTQQDGVSVNDGCGSTDVYKRQWLYRAVLMRMTDSRACSDVLRAKNH